MRKFLTVLALCAASPALAGEADVIAAKASPMGGGQWRVDATVQHADTGWDHYANAFQVFAPDGTLLETRVLYHPHVEEQPFTRSVTVSIPGDVSEITIRAVDSVHGEGGAAVVVTLER